MEAFLIAVLIVVLMVRWAVLRNRLDAMTERMDALQKQIEWMRKTGGLAGHAAPPVQAETGFSMPTASTAEPSAAAIPPLAPVAEPPELAPVALAVPVEAETVVAPATAVPATALPADGLKPVLPLVPAMAAMEEASAPVPDKPARTSADWEALVGGNWINKIGVFLVVMGLAYWLGVSFTNMSPAGRVAVGLGASFALLVAGVVLEKRERYGNFARGLLGGGWAALYFTVYAAQAIDAAKVIDSPVLGALLLLAVGVGMVAHSLRYHSETVTGVAYFLSFVTLGITQVTALSVIALVPLAASLLYLSHRFGWRKMAILGLVATYGIVALQHDTGAPLWEAQAVFTIYWLLFEGFDIMHPSPAMLPLNAIGFLGLSAAKWHMSAPGREWQIVAASGLAYLVSTVVRARRTEWRWSVTLTGALAAAAIFLELHNQWITLALLIEAELYYLAGVRFGSRYLRILAQVVFGLELGQLLTFNATGAPYRTWTPVAALNVVVFYCNRVLRSTDVIYGYAGASMAALAAGYEAHGDRGLAWYALSAGPFVVGWLRRLPDFRYQAYGLATLGMLGLGIAEHEPPVSLAICAALAYAAVLTALWGEEHFLENEASAVRLTASLAATTLLAALAWQLSPEVWRGVVWMGLALGLLELGLRDLPRDLRRQAYGLAALGAVVVMVLNLPKLNNFGPAAPRLIPALAALAAYVMAARAQQQEGGKVLKAATFVGTFFAMVALWALLPETAVGPAWAALAVILAETGIPVLRLEASLVSGLVVGRLGMSNIERDGRLLTVTPVLVSHYYLWWRTRWRFYLFTATALAATLIYYQAAEPYRAPAWALFTAALLFVGHRRAIRDLCWQSYALAALAFGTCWAWDFAPAQSVLAAAVVVGCLYGAQLIEAEGRQERLYFSLSASLLAAGLLYSHVSGSMLTVAWALEGITLLAAGFPLNDRNQRLSGLALLLFCILKLFAYDLQHLGRMPYIVSLIALGLILLAVSWIYTRFRERVQKYL